MPRAKKTLAGTPGQKVEAIKGQTYGEGVQQERLQNAMPAPNAPQIQASAQPAEPAQPRPQISFQDAMNQVSGMGGILRAPDDRPSIPVTDGLASGPGRGPEALMGSSALGNTLRRLAVQTGDPVFNELISKVNF